MNNYLGCFVTVQIKSFRLIRFIILSSRDYFPNVTTQTFSTLASWCFWNLLSQKTQLKYSLVTVVQKTKKKKTTKKTHPQHQVFLHQTLFSFYVLPVPTVTVNSDSKASYVLYMLLCSQFFLLLFQMIPPVKLNSHNPAKISLCFQHCAHQHLFLKY